MMYMGKACLLSIDGTEIEVENHPSVSISDDFNDICEVIKTHGDDIGKNLVSAYESDGTNIEDILVYYQVNWCKVRTWGTFQDELTFRIESTDKNWYRAIIDFLLRHLEFKDSEITVESANKKIIYWDKVTYEYATDSQNEQILSASLIEYDDSIIC